MVTSIIVTVWAVCVILNVFLFLSLASIEENKKVKDLTWGDIQWLLEQDNTWAPILVLGILLSPLGIIIGTVLWIVGKIIQFLETNKNNKIWGKNK